MTIVIPRPDKKAGEGKNDDAKRLLWLQMTWL